MRIPKKKLPEILDYLSKDDLHRSPSRWDIWFYFTSELPIEIIYNDIRFHRLFDRNDDEPLNSPHGRSLMMPLAFWRPDEEEFGPHRELIVTQPIGLHTSSPIMIIAFLTKEHGKDIPLKELLVQAEKDVFTKCFCLWEDIGIPGYTLIKYFATYKGNPCTQKIMGLIHEFLRLKTPQWGCDYEDKRKATGFCDGELIVVTDPLSKNRMPGVIIGDLAVTGHESSIRPANVLFLRLYPHKPAHSSEQATLFVPADVKYQGIAQSVALLGFRFAPLKYLSKWKSGETILRPQIMAEIRSRLGGVF